MAATRAGRGRGFPPRPHPRARALLTPAQLLVRVLLLLARRASGGRRSLRARERASELRAASGRCWARSGFGFFLFCFAFFRIARALSGRAEAGKEDVKRAGAQREPEPGADGRPGGRVPQAVGLQEPLRPGQSRRVNPGLGEALPRHGGGEPAQVEFRFPEPQAPGGQVRVAGGGEELLARVLLQTPAPPEGRLQGAGAGEPGCQRAPPAGAFNGVPGKLRGHAFGGAEERCCGQPDGARRAVQEATCGGRFQCSKQKSQQNRRKRSRRFPQRRLRGADAQEAGDAKTADVKPTNWGSVSLFIGYITA